VYHFPPAKHKANRRNENHFSATEKAKNRKNKRYEIPTTTITGTNKTRRQKLVSVKLQIQKTQIAG